MKKQIILAMLGLLSLVAMAQPKVNGLMPLREERGFDQRIVVDTADFRVLYALNADDLSDENTYIDLGRVEVSKRMTKYSSEFLHLQDQYVMKWMKENNWKYTTVYTSKSLGYRGRPDKWEKWSELVSNDYFVENKQLTEWASFPEFATWEYGRYTEPWPLMTWQLLPDTMTIIGYPCQKATSHFRGRDFEAWFTTEIPVRSGPWKFGGLPGMIMKVQDVDGYYRWEAVGVEKGVFPIEKYPEKLYPVRSREKIWKLQRVYNVNYWKAVGYVFEGKQPGDAIFEQLEKE